MDPAGRLVGPASAAALALRFWAPVDPCWASISARSRLSETGCSALERLQPSPLRSSAEKSSEESRSPMRSAPSRPRRWCSRRRWCASISFDWPTRGSSSRSNSLPSDASRSAPCRITMRMSKCVKRRRHGVPSAPGTPFSFAGGSHWGTCETMASTAWLPAMRVSQHALCRYLRTLARRWCSS
uniref:Uncharacterized protein n=1 Tax=Ixodes ricinus TaxID=34613 RepID=A0A6B0UZM2_IXORI